MATGESGPVRIALAETPEALEQARTLFREYWASFGFTPCFQGFSTELDGLAGEYTGPSGRLALALVNGEPAGCVAMRPVDSARCEAKRLYVRPGYRGLGIGRTLLQWLVAEARQAGYREIVADTMPVMSLALEMYDRAGFERTAPYSDKPTPGAIYLRLTL